MLIVRNDGTEVACSWKSNALGIDVPSLVVAGKFVQVAKALKWYEWVWSALPLVLVFAGGALGAVFGLIGTSFNLNSFRSRLNRAVKFVVVAVISLATGYVFYIAAAFVFGFMQAIFKQ